VFEQGGDTDALVHQCRQALAAGDQDRAFELVLWITTLGRIRKIERMLTKKQQSSE